MKRFFILIVFGISILIHFVKAEKIIVLTPFATRSHKNVFFPLVEELANRGHDVIFVSPMISPKIIPNVREIDIAKNLDILSSLEGNIFNQSVKGGLLKHLEQHRSNVQKTTRNFLTHPEIKNFLKSSGQIFDLAIINGRMNEVCLMIAPLIAKNIILLTPGSIPPPTPLSSPMSLATLPVPHFAVSSRMSFYERFKNTAYYLLLGYINPFLTQRETEKIVWEYLPEASSLSESKNKISLLLNNGDPVLSIPKPIGSASVDIGGMHCKAASSLPKIFADFIESDKDEGVIIFSLGSVVPAHTMPDVIRSEFVSAFSQLKQKIIWKFEDSIENLPSNIMVTPWMPQQDILAHPKVRLFITHGGTLSLQESVFHGVPLIGIPLFADQHGNIARIVELGLGERLNIFHLNASVIIDTIGKIIFNSSYEQNVKKYSSIVKDQTEPPVKRAAFWVEYVIRHDGANHLKEANNDLFLFQYFLLDVITGITIALGISSGLCFLIIKLMLMKVSSWKKK